MQTLNPILTSGAIFASLFGASFVGLRLRALLPNHHLTSETKESVRLGMGSVATMAALVLGLLVASTKSAYDTEKTEVMQMASRLIYLDGILANYGPEAAEAREMVRHSTEASILRIWPDAKLVAEARAPDRSWTLALPRAIQQLTPATEAQKAFKAQAASIANDLGQMRWLLFEQMESSISIPLLVITAFWVSLTFLSVGLFAPFNGTVLIAQLMAAFAVAGAIFLILELDQPFDGLVAISSHPMVNAHQQMGH